jgi:pyridoxamine 5'-phosphate oxidase
MAAFDQLNLTTGQGALPEPLPADPWPIFQAWFDEAHARQITPNPNAMVLATVDDQARPAARVVLCKEIVADPGYIVFFTNYQSRKGVELAGDPHAACVFHWDALQRQARLEGRVTRSPASESDQYFASRPLESRIGAWASDQSRPIASRQALIDRVNEVAARHNVDPETSPDDTPIPRPPHWGGYRFWVSRMELWVSGHGRVHDRGQWSRPLTPSSDGFTPGSWDATRLQP